MKHNIIIPGLDRELCGNCGKYICRPGELERLKRALDKAKSASKPKKDHIAKLESEYKMEVNLSQCCVPRKKLSQG